MAKPKSTKPTELGQPRTFEQAVADGDCLSDEDFERQAALTFRTLGALLKTIDKPPPPPAPLTFLAEFRVLLTRAIVNTRRCLRGFVNRLIADEAESRSIGWWLR